MPKTKTSAMLPWLTAQMNGQTSAAEPSAPIMNTGLRPIRSASSRPGRDGDQGDDVGRR